ncbi:hypothetical protein ACVBGC_31485 [Burkholderia stagnalis]
MSNAANDAIERLLTALDHDGDECWAMYEEIGRVVVGRLLRVDRDALREIARAWLASDDAQAALLDTARDSPDLDAAQARAERADGAMRDAVRQAVFGAA